MCLSVCFACGLVGCCCTGVEARLFCASQGQRAAKGYTSRCTKARLRGGVRVGFGIPGLLFLHIFMSVNDFRALVVPGFFLLFILTLFRASPAALQNKPHTRTYARTHAHTCAAHVPWTWDSISLFWISPFESDPTSSVSVRRLSCTSHDQFARGGGVLTTQGLREIYAQGVERGKGKGKGKGMWGVGETHAITDDIDCGQQYIQDAIIITAVMTGQIHIVQKQKTEKYGLSCPSL